MATDVDEAERARVASGRSCGSCSYCCKLFSIVELKKPRGQWCIHCKPGHGGCSIYEQRPQACQDFYCGWLIGTLSQEWEPQRSKMVATTSVSKDGRAVDAIITVDPAYPNRWREEPYYSQIKQLAINCLIANARTLVRVGRRYFAIFPSNDVDIGMIDDDAEFPQDRIALIHSAVKIELSKLRR